MGADRYKVVITHAKTGQQTKREWSAAELMAGVQWLKRLNARGGDIRIRSIVGPELRDELLARVSRGLGEAGQYGRLAGFTNQQAAPNATGLQPFALRHNATGQVALLATQHLSDVQRGKARNSLVEQSRVIDVSMGLKGNRGRSR